MKMWAIMRRDLLKLSRNPLTLLSTILMPIVYLVIIGNSFNGNLKHLSLAVVSQDHGEYGRRMVEKLQALEAGPKTLTLSYVDNLGDAVDQVRKGTYKAAVVIPPDFTKSINEGRLAEVGVFTDNVDSVSAGTLEAVLEQAAATLPTDFVTAREPKLHQIVMRPSELFTTVDYDRSLIPGVIVMSLFMGSLMSGVFNWVMDRFMGVTECYLVTPLSRWEIAGGILASGVTITSVAAIIVLFIGLADYRRHYRRRVSRADDYHRHHHSRCDRPASDDVLSARSRDASAAGWNLRGILECDPVFPERRDLSDRELSRMATAFAQYNPEMHAVSALKSILFKGAVFGAVRGDLTFLVVFTAIMLVFASMSFKRTL